LISLFVPCFSTVKTKASAQEEKTIDVYLIAGQSNAVGYSNVSSVDSSRVKSEYQTGFDNIYFYGRSEWAYHTTYNTPVKFGQGQNADRFGAEVGIADVLQPYYTDASGKEAIIVKYSAGGTYLTDNTVHSFTETFGNWCPPSKKSGDKSKEKKEKNSTVKKRSDFFVAQNFSLIGYNDIMEKGRIRCGFVLSIGERYNAFAKTMVEARRTFFFSGLTAQIRRFLTKRN
ncbi:MAG: hypothetical protein IIX01_01880, partial [Clostridia bacterium]|nr:hypothetical protein [Clostridia bacterium]